MILFSKNQYSSLFFHSRHSRLNLPHADVERQTDGATIRERGTGREGGREVSDTGNIRDDASEAADAQLERPTWPRGGVDVRSRLV